MIEEKIRVYGAGLAGLVVGNVLRHYDVHIHEQQEQTPDNHGALLRFRDGYFAKMVGLEFKECLVRKEIHDPNYTAVFPNIKLCNMYSHKVTGKYSNRSIFNLEPVTRFIAPDNLISKLERLVPTTYGSALSSEAIAKNYNDGVATISTIPVTNLIEMAINDVDGLMIPKEMADSLTRIKFESNCIGTIRVKIDKCDLYQTVYYPHKESFFYRASVSGNMFMLEFIPPEGFMFADYGDNTILLDELRDQAAECIHNSFGINFDRNCVMSCTSQRHGKIVSLSDEDQRAVKNFIAYMSNEWCTYSVGRFATWRQLLLDDLIKDVGVVEELIKYNNSLYLSNQKKI